MTGIARLGMPLQLFTFLALVTVAVIALYSMRTDKARLVRITSVAGGTVAAAYVLLLFSVSLTSQEHTLAPGAAKRFCGFYIDCHVMVSIDDTRTSKTIGAGPEASTAAGIFYVVTVSVSSDADQVPLGLADPGATIIDNTGRRYHISASGQRALEAETERQTPLEQTVTAGSGFTTTLVFDLPEDVAEPRLLIQERDWIARLSELFLIGDEDSLLHKKVLLQLTT